jgi:hypothetical protein
MKPNGVSIDVLSTLWKAKRLVWEFGQLESKSSLISPGAFEVESSGGNKNAYATFLFLYVAIILKNTAIYSCFEFRESCMFPASVCSSRSGQRQLVHVDEYLCRTQWGLEMVRGRASYHGSK